MWKRRQATLSERPNTCDKVLAWGTSQQRGLPKRSYSNSELAHRQEKKVHLLQSSSEFSIRQRQGQTKWNHQRRSDLHLVSNLLILVSSHLNYSKGKFRKQSSKQDQGSMKKTTREKVPNLNPRNFLGELCRIFGILGILDIQTETRDFGKTLRKNSLRKHCDWENPKSEIFQKQAFHTRQLRFLGNDDTGPDKSRGRMRKWNMGIVISQTALPVPRWARHSSGSSADNLIRWGVVGNRLWRYKTSDEKVHLEGWRGNLTRDKFVYRSQHEERVSTRVLFSNFPSGPSGVYLGKYVVFIFLREQFWVLKCVLLDKDHETSALTVVWYVLVSPCLGVSVSVESEPGLSFQVEKRTGALHVFSTFTSNMLVVLFSELCASWDNIFKFQM